MRELILLTGGARSGKTTFALRLAQQRGGRVAYLATAQPGDAEMYQRIQHHQRQRPAHWRTVEEPLAVPAAFRRIAAAADIIILDCVTTWVANLLLASLPDIDRITPEQAAAGEAAVMAAVGELLSSHKSTDTCLVVITNEVGLGLVPDNPLGRLYRDVLGRANQQLAVAAARVYLLVAGLALELRSLGAASVVTEAGSGEGTEAGSGEGRAAPGVSSQRPGV